jgi:hypothetical protein
MARLTVLAPVPPSRSSAASAGAALVRALRRRGHKIRVVWPVPEDVEALLARSDLAVHLVSGDPEDADGYRVAVEHPGLVVLPDLDLGPVIRELVRSRDPAGRPALREAQAAGGEAGAWSAHVARRARGLVVGDEAARADLRRIGCRTPVFVAPPDDDRAEGLHAAVDATVALIRDPAEWAVGRWASALADCGVGPGELAAEGYGLRYAEALDELRRSPAGSP